MTIALVFRKCQTQLIGESLIFIGIFILANSHMASNDWAKVNVFHSYQIQKSHTLSLSLYPIAYLTNFPGDFSSISRIHTYTYHHYLSILFLGIARQIIVIFVTLIVLYQGFSFNSHCILWCLLYNNYSLYIRRSRHQYQQ